MAGRRAKSDSEKQFNSAVGARIEAERAACGLSHKELAARIGISSSHLYFYETGRSACPPYRLRRLACALGIEVQRLLPQIHY